MTTALIVLVNSVPVGYVFIFFTPRTADLCDLYDLYDLYALHDPPHAAECKPYNQYHRHDRGLFPGLDLYYTDPVQPLTTAAGEELDDLGHDLSDLFVGSYE